MRTAIIDKARREFTARYLADISKAIFAVALASKFFIDLIQWLRIFLTTLGFVLFIMALFIEPKKGENP